MKNFCIEKNRKLKKSVDKNVKVVYNKQSQLRELDALARERATMVH